MLPFVVLQRKRYCWVDTGPDRRLHRCFEYFLFIAGVLRRELIRMKLRIGQLYMTTMHEYTHVLSIDGKIGMLLNQN